MAKIATKYVDVATGTVTFQFMDGTSFVYNLNDLSGEMVHRAALHGLSQKGGDSYASADSIEEAKANVREVWANLLNGNWTVRSTGKLAEALHRATGLPMDEVLEKLAGKTDAEKKDLRKHPAVKKALAEIDMERAAAAAKAAEDTEESLNL